MRSFSVVCPASTLSMGASVQRMPAVSRPAWMLALSGFADRGGAPRRSPVEIVATMGSYLTRTQAAEGPAGAPGGGGRPAPPPPRGGAPPHEGWGKGVLGGGGGGSPPPGPAEL